MNDFPLFDYRLAGRSAGPVLLFLHGFFGDRREWDEIAPRFEQDCLCLTVDLPGHGQTRLATGFENAAMPDVAAALLALLDLLEIRSCSLIGYSMGGRLALQMAVLQPARFTSLVLESASPGMRSDQERRERMAEDDRRAGQLLDIGLEAFLNQWYSQPMFQTLRANPAHLDALIRRRLDNDPGQLARALRVMSVGRQPSLWQQWSANRIPALLVAGALDPKYGGIAAEMAGLCTAARLCVIDGCGHNVHYEDPQAYTEHMKRFLSVLLAPNDSAPTKEDVDGEMDSSGDLLGHQV